MFVFIFKDSLVAVTIALALVTYIVILRSIILKKKRTIKTWRIMFYIICAMFAIYFAQVFIQVFLMGDIDVETPIVIIMTIALVFWFSISQDYRNVPLDIWKDDESQDVEDSDNSKDTHNTEEK